MGSARTASIALCLAGWCGPARAQDEEGTVIAVRNRQGQDVARGLANYASSEARLIARKASSEIESVLGFTTEPEMIHRDNLVLA